MRPDQVRAIVGAEVFEIVLGAQDPDGNLPIDIETIAGQVIRGHLLNGDRLRLIRALQDDSPARVHLGAPNARKAQP